MTVDYENILRGLIIQLIGGNDGDSYKISSERLIKWKEKREIEAKKNRGTLIETRILYYSDFYDLKTIINKNWELFSPIINNKKRFEIFFDEVEHFRNTVAHGRNLTLSQEYLLKGIFFDLKNLITIYHNRNEMKEDYFIELIQISDNLGNTWKKYDSNPKPILRVGDEYELTIEANDPKGRTIQYEIFTCASPCKLKMIQDTNRFNFTISNDMIGKSSFFYVRVETPDSEYKNTDGIEISLTILPK